MKKQSPIKWVVTILCLGLFIFSCENTITEIETIENESQIPIQLSHRILNAEISETRMIDNKFQQDDLIGLFLVKQSQSFTGDRHIDNAMYKFDGGKFVTTATYYYPEAKTPVKFFAYYPYNESGLNAGSNLLNITVKSDQSTDTAYSQSDFLTAFTSNVIPTNKNVHLDFHHKLSKINFIIEPVLESDLALLEKDGILTLSNLGTSASYNIDDNIISKPSNTGNIIPNGTWKIAEQKVIGKKAIIVPQNGSAIKIILNVDGREFASNFSATELQPGTSYDVLLKFDSRIGVTQITHEVSDWIKDETGVEGDFGEVFESQSINVNSIDFDISSVYDVVNSENQVIGTICKEYLFNDAIETVALVYYNVSAPTVGRILKTLGTDNSMNGGTITWSNNSFSYQASEAPQNVSMLILNATGDIIASPLTDSPYISGKPHLFIDNRGAESIQYPIVKIGTQFWMREDLKTKLYNDGTPIVNNTNDLSLKTAGYYENNRNVFYNDAAVATNKMNAVSWKIPTESQWGILKTYIGDVSAKLKIGDSWFVKEGIDRPNNQTGFCGVHNGGYFESNSSIVLGSTNHYLLYWKIKDSVYELPEKGVLISALLNHVHEVNVRSGCGFSIRFIKE